MQPSLELSLQLAMLDRAIQTAKRPHHRMARGEVVHHFVKFSDGSFGCERDITEPRTELTQYCPAGMLYEASVYLTGGPDAADKLIDTFDRSRSRDGVHVLTWTAFEEGWDAILSMLKKRRKKVRRAIQTSR